MLAILNSLNDHNFPIFEPILMILASKFMFNRFLSDKTYLSFWVAVPFKTAGSTASAWKINADFYQYVKSTKISLACQIFI